MSRKLLLFIIIPALVLIAGYFVLQTFLRANIKKEAAALGEPVAQVDSLGGKKVSAIDLRPLFVERLQLLLKKSSHDLYDLKVGDLKLDVLASTLSFQNVTVTPRKAVADSLKAKGLLPSNVLNITFKSLDIEGINLDDAITSKTMDYKLARLVSPVIHIQQGKKEKKKEAGDFMQSFLKEMEKLSVKKLVVSDGKIVVHNRQGSDAKTLSNVQINMDDILVDSTTRNDKSRFLFAKQTRLSFSNYESKSKDGLYRFKLGNVAVNTAEKQVVLKNVSFGSPLSKQAFVSRQKQAKELYTLSIPTLTVTGVDWWAALNEEEVVAKEITGTGGKFSIYFDRSLPPKNKMGNFPNQLLMKMPMKLDIDKLALRNLDVSYEEYNPVSAQSGTVYIDNASMTIRNINNSRGNKTPMVVNGTALFMHKVPLTASFRFDMAAYKAGSFSATLNTDKSFDATLINDIASPLGLMRIDKGTINKLQATMKGNEMGATGDVLLLYNDLKLSLLEKDKGKKDLDKKDVTSLLANLLVLKKENPKGGKPARREQAKYTRDPTGGFMMVVWKTAMVGVLRTIGAPEKIAYKKAGK